MIVLENGKNVFPEEIEEYLESIEQIAESVVVGRPSKDKDSIILTAIIYPDFSRFPEDATAEEIAAKLKDEINRMNKRLVGYKQIRAIEVRSTEFEKTTTKKLSGIWFIDICFHKAWQAPRRGTCQAFPLHQRRKYTQEILNQTLPKSDFTVFARHFTAARNRMQKIIPHRTHHRSAVKTSARLKMQI